MSENELGPIYNVPLLDSLPLNYGSDDMLQQLPSRADLMGVIPYRQGQRVVAGYEVLLNHWRDQKAERDAIRKAFAPILDWYNEDGETDDMALMIRRAVEDVQRDRAECLAFRAKHVEEGGDIDDWCPHCESEDCECDDNPMKSK